ncbi:hypothetical protein ACFYUR_12380 [Micromonospora haikouensis]|uniref:hypothetical protein n=1 Tax=Micromonospora haikouensis TaxID=686309 RepID=UPI0036BF68E0
MSWWRRLRLWVLDRQELVEQVRDLTRRSDILTAWLRREQAARAADVEALRRDLAACRREAESLDAGNRALDAENRRERRHGSQLAHRNRAAWEFADRLPAHQAAELRRLLSLRLPAASVESADV